MISQYGSTSLELPEEVDLHLEIANLGTRILAILVDLALCGVIMFSLYSVMPLISGEAGSNWFSQLGASTLLILLYLLVFGFQWGYFNLFEWLWNGQTPGKRLLRIRVIKADGSPVSWSDVFLRNLSRPVDTFSPLLLIGLLMIFINRKGQRLGDLMAQTMVVREVEIDWSLFSEEKSSTEQTSLIRLTPAQWEMLRSFLNRREEFQPEARARVAESLHELLKPAVTGTELERMDLPTEEWLQEVAKRS